MNPAVDRISIAALRRRLDTTVGSAPAYLRWIERCDPAVVGAYRTARRGFLLYRLPASFALILLALVLKGLRLVPAGHPLVQLSLIASIVLIAWPLPYLRLAATAWSFAPSTPDHRWRLRLLAVVLFATGAVTLLGYAGLALLVAYGLVGPTR